ncbi:MAG TPA: carboxymuconolactone decarboxylase family protein [Acidimicrobiales bacterium]|nr:carboxymuconolactone decarboxylase family protein [Acidimicrobiales bacterium]
MASDPRPIRISPLPESERDEMTKELLHPLQVDGADLNIFATLVRHPRLFKRWSAFGGALLVRGELPARDRELLILRTAWNCQADYEWGQHARIARTSGVTDDEVTRSAQGPDVVGWSLLEAALLRACDELHHVSSISNETWRVLAEHYDEHQLIEICMVIGQYHLVAFTLNSLGVEREPGVEGLPG